MENNINIAGQDSDYILNVTLYSEISNIITKQHHISLAQLRNVPMSHAHVIHLGLSTQVCVCGFIAKHNQWYLMEIYPTHNPYIPHIIPFLLILHNSLM